MRLHQVSLRRLRSRDRLLHALCVVYDVRSLSRWLSARISTGVLRSGARIVYDSFYCRVAAAAADAGGSVAASRVTLSF